MEISKDKKIYFSSDNHLGSPSTEESQEREKIFVSWLESIKHDADIMVASIPYPVNLPYAIFELEGKKVSSFKEKPSYKDIDLVIPVPLDKKRLKKRGYNQCDSIVVGLAQEMNKSFRLNAVQRIRSNESQTKKGRFERWINVNEHFAVTEPDFLAGKHVLLVDDVVTTGATIEACASAILLVPGAFNIKSLAEVVDIVVSVILTCCNCTLSPKNLLTTVPSNSNSIG